jgi:hypothetical protein
MSDATFLPNCLRVMDGILYVFSGSKPRKKIYERIFRIRGIFKEEPEMYRGGGGGGYKKKKKKKFKKQPNKKTMELWH